MRPLNRPMFRMGGPIKEGIMHGIREPYRGGGKAALVGNPLYPRTAGREHHFETIGTGMMEELTGGAQGFNKKKVALPTKSPGYFGNLLQKGKNLLSPTKKVKRVGKLWDKFKNVYKGAPKDKNYVPPGALTNRWYWEKGIKPTLGLTAAAGKKALPYAGTAGIAGAVYGFWPDGTPKTNPELLNMNNIQSRIPGVPGGGDPNMGYVDPEKAKKLAAKKRDERVTNLLETMGYDAAKKDAVSKALIDASQIVSDRGTLDKKNITAELINPIIQATSKRLEKPEQLNEAVRLMLTKAEIEKEMNPLDSQLKQWQIEAYKKQAKGKTLSETIAEAAGKSTPLTGESLAASARSLLKGDFKVLNEKVPKKADTLEFITDVVKKSHAAGKPFPPGQYVLKERVIRIDEQGNVTPLDL